MDKFPDKILLTQDTETGNLHDEWVLRNLTQCKDMEYIRKDIFTNKVCDTFCRFCGHDAIKTQGYTCRQDCGYYREFKEAIMED